MIINSSKLSGCGVDGGIDLDQSMIQEAVLSLGQEYFPEFCRQRNSQGFDKSFPQLSCSPIIADPFQMGLSELHWPYQPPVQHALDVNGIRRDFPILFEKIDGKNLVWFDNAATTQKPRHVIERMKFFYEHENSNVHRGAHTLAARTTDAYENARSSVASFLHADSADEIVFVRGTTEGINLVAQAYGMSFLTQDDEIVISLLEHHANIVPWQIVCARTGAKLKVVPVNEDGQIDLSAYRKFLGKKTKIVAFTHVSNALGTITPAAEMVHMAHQFGAKVIIDGAQAVAHQMIDVRELDCDFYVFSGHKVFGPTGIGVLYGKAEVLNSMQPYQSGGSMIDNVTFEKTTYKKPPHRFEAGTGNIAGAIGLAAALEYITGIGLSRISEYEHLLYLHGEESLRSINGLTLIGSAASRGGILPFVCAHISADEVGAILNKEGIAVRAGHHCAQPILRRFGHENTVRVSLALYNTMEEMDFLTSVLRHQIRANTGTFPF